MFYCFSLQKGRQKKEQKTFVRKRGRGDRFNSFFYDPYFEMFYKINDVFLFVKLTSVTHFNNLSS